MQLGNIFYVYLLLREVDGLPFYVGKGKGQRLYDHQRIASKGGNSHKSNIIRKVILQLGYLPTKKVATGLTEQQAFFLEKSLIIMLKMAGCKLVNQTDGGEGTAGRLLSIESREKLKYKRTPEQLQNLHAAYKAWIATPEGRQKFSLAAKAGGRAIKGYRHTPEAKKNFRRGAQTRVATPEGQAQLRCAIDARSATPEACERQRLAMQAAGRKNKGCRHSPEVIAKRTASIRASWARRRAAIAINKEQNA